MQASGFYSPNRFGGTPSPAALGHHLCWKDCIVVSTLTFELCECFNKNLVWAQNRPIFCRYRKPQLTNTAKSEDLPPRGFGGKRR